jgi:hypothetical protein
LNFCKRLLGYDMYMKRCKGVTVFLWHSLRTTTRSKECSTAGLTSISSSRGLGAWTRALKVRTHSSHSFLCNAQSNGEILSLTSTSSSPLCIQGLQRLSSQKEMLRTRYAVMFKKIIHP